jgi:hypothetical protein
LAIAVGLWARWIGLDRDRAFYPTVMIVIAVLYILFAVISDSLAALIPEGLVSAGFIALACAGSGETSGSSSRRSRGTGSSISFTRTPFTMRECLFGGRNSAAPTTSLPPCSSAGAFANPNPRPLISAALRRFPQGPVPIQRAKRPCGSETCKMARPAPSSSEPCSRP